MTEVDVIVADPRWSAAWPEVETSLPGIVEAVLAQAAARPAGDVELALRLDSDQGIRALNRRWRRKDAPTNVLSFPAGPGPAGGRRHLGDIVLAYETALGEAEAQAKSLADHAAHLVVHGVLHLLGHDHEREAEAEAMEALEVEALARLGVADPYRQRAD